MNPNIPKVRSDIIPQCLSVEDIL